MVKVYDMVTYGVCEPEQEAPILGFTVPHAANMATVPVPGLQLVEVSPTASRQELHPSLRYTDVSSFLTPFDD